MLNQQISQIIAAELTVQPKQILAAIQLLDDGNTIPFIARYRKEATGGLDDTQLRHFETRLIYLRELEDRRQTILKSIEEQGKLTDELRDKIHATQSKTELEDLYLPYKPKRRTKGQIAIEAGLEPLAEALGGILSMILGRSGGASLAKLGSLAVLGNLAYQAYQNYQKSQQNSQPNISENAFDVLNSSSHVDAGELILRTMIAAAAADGEITEDEKQTIANEAGNNPELAQWLEQEIQNPISINEIARLVGNDTALASNVYLAARLVSKDLSRKEIIFLADLAQALGLDDALVEQLEKQAGF